MPFTRDNTYSDAAAVNAADVRANHEGARGFVNRGIDPADIAEGAVNWSHIQPGEYAYVSVDHRFVTGNVSGQFVDSAPEHLTTYGVSMKTEPDSDLWVVCLGKRVYVGVDNSFAVIRYYLHLHPREGGIVASESGEASKAMLFIDGAQVADTEAHFYARDSATSNAGTGILESRWRYASVHYIAAGLDKGWHDIEVRVNPRHSIVPAHGRILTVEVFEA